MTHTTLFEEHGSVLADWWANRGTGAPPAVVSFDAHLDLQRVSDERLAALASCDSPDQVSRLEKPHHLYPDRGFSFGLEDFLYPAHRLGLINEVIWVAPPFVWQRGVAPALVELAQLDGVTLSDLASFERHGAASLRGELLGVRITMTRLEELPRLPIPDAFVIDVDCDYFIEVPADRPWAGPRDLVNGLGPLREHARAVTIARSVSSGFTPLRHRFLAEHLAALLSGDEVSARHFQELFDADDALHRGHRVAAAEMCRAEQARTPDCAATWYLSSLCERGEPARCARARAVEVERAYAESPLRMACEIRARGLRPTRARTRWLAERLTASETDDDEKALGRAALGLLACEDGEVAAAQADWVACSDRLGPHPELGLAIARVLDRDGRVAEAVPYLEAALADDKTRTAAHARLARVDSTRGEIEAAIEHLEAAHRAAEAWSELLEPLITLHRARGDTARIAHLESIRAQHDATAAALRERLGDGLG